MFSFSPEHKKIFSAASQDPVAGPVPPGAPVNLFFGTAADMEELKAKDNSSEAYLILQNNQMFAENARLRTRIERLRTEKETVVADHDNVERSRTCLKGLLHNEIEINQIHKSIRDAHASDIAQMRGAAFMFVFEVMVSAVIIAGTVTVHAMTAQREDIILITQLFLCAGTAMSAVLYASNTTPTDLSALEAELSDAQSASKNLHAVIDEL